MKNLPKRIINARLTAFVVVLALGTACSGFSRHTDAIPSSAPKQYGSGLSVPKQTPVSKATTGTLDMRVIDLSGRALVGAIIKYTGAATGTVTTNARGVGRATVRAGNYKIELLPCGTTIVTQTARGGSASVGRGQVLTLTLDQIKWKRRFTPSQSVISSEPPPWGRSKRVRLGIRIEDGCTFAEGKNASISEYRWRTASPFRILGAASAADAKGNANIDVACTAAGDGSISIYDARKPEDSIDLLLQLSAPPPGEHWCA